MRGLYSRVVERVGGKALLKSEGIDILEPTLVEKVHEYADIDYYTQLLDALDKEAMRLGYCFVKRDKGVRLPVSIEESLGLAVAKRRYSLLNPLSSKDDDYLLAGYLESGYALMWARILLGGLAATGITLQETPQAVATMKEETT